MPDDKRATRAIRPVTWLSTEEAAIRIGMSRYFVRDRIEAGDLEATAWKSGTRVLYRIRSDDLDAFVAEWSFSPLDPRLDRRAPGTDA